MPHTSTPNPQAYKRLTFGLILFVLFSSPMSQPVITKYTSPLLLSSSLYLRPCPCAITLYRRMQHPYNRISHLRCCKLLGRSAWRAHCLQHSSARYLLRNGRSWCALASGMHPCSNRRCTTRSRSAVRRQNADSRQRRADSRWSRRCAASAQRAQSARQMQLAFACETRF